MPPLLLLHGAIGAKEQFEPLQAALTEQVAVHTLDFEGHGAAALRARPFAIAHFAENVITYLDVNEIEQAHIFGHSMGGYVGLYMTQHYPDRIGRVFTLGTKLAWSPEFAAGEVRNMDPDRMLEKVPQFARVLEARHTDWRANLAKSREMTLALGDNPPLTLENLATIEHLVRLGIGDKDRMVTLEETIAAYRAMPNGQLHVIPATAHPLERIHVGRVAAAIIDFLSA